MEDVYPVYNASYYLLQFKHEVTQYGGVNKMSYLLYCKHETTSDMETASHIESNSYSSSGIVGFKNIMMHIRLLIGLS